MRSGRVFRSATWLGVVTVSLAAVALVGSVMVASATPRQAAPPTTCDPTYGCQPPPTNPPSVRCHMHPHAGHPGKEVTITCTGVAAGTAVEVRWDGKVVASGATQAGTGGMAPAAVGPVAVFDRGVVAPGEATRASAPPVRSFIRYPAPNLAPKVYDVVISGPTFSVDVGRFTLLGQVKGETVSNAVPGGAANPDPAGGSGSTSGSLAYTGLQIALWAFAALAVLAAGYALARYGRRRGLS